jgi:hypothetical protein
MINMKKNLLFSIICFGALFAKAQITVTSSQMPSSGDTARMSLANLNSIGNYTATGANFNWDFNNLVPTDQVMREFKPSFQTPYAFYFLPPKYGEKTLDAVPIPNIPLGGLTITIEDIYSFYRKNGTSSFNSEGLGLKLSGIPVGATYTDEDELYLFPLNYLNRDSTRFSLTTPSNTLVPFTYKKHGYRITEADGWGTITTPFGTENCLRVVTTQYSIDTIYIPALPSGFNKIGFPNYMRSYQWLTLNDNVPYLEVSGNLVGNNFTPTQARYRDRIRYFVGIEEKRDKVSVLFNIYPNPSSNSIALVFNNNSIKMDYYIADLSGKVVKSGVISNEKAEYEHQILLTELPKGLYHFTLSDNKTQQTIKFSLQ